MFKSKPIPIRLTPLLLLLLAAAVAGPLPTTTAATENEDRYVVLGTAIGEMLYAFGRGEAVVARDSSCQLPAEIEEKPEIGYFRAVPVEGVLAMRPTEIFSTDAAGPPNAVAQLKASGITYHEFSSEPTLDALRTNILRMGKLLDKPDRAEDLLGSLNREILHIPEIADTSRVEVLFLLSPPGSSQLLAAGAGTAAHAMIQLAGGRNVFADMQGYRPVSAELIASHQPDVIFVPRRGDADAASLGAEHAVIDRLVAGGQSRRIEIDLAGTLAFGIRTGHAASALHRKLYQP